MSQKSIKKITVTVGVGLLTATLNPSFFNHQLLTELSVEATTSKITYTDEQKITYNLDTVSMTAEVDSYSGLAGADIIIPDNISNNGKLYAVTSIGTYAFLNSGIHSVIIGNNIVDINTSAFQTTTAFPDYYKKSLTEVVLGANVQNIKTDAFSGNAISSIEFPDSVIKIATRAFANNNLTELSFGPNITEIMAKAFQSNQITTIEFTDESSTVVDSAAFSGSPVRSLILGIEVTLADDVFNKISPLFGQLSDLPTDGVRKIYVDSNGVLEKSWLNLDISQPNSVNTEDIDIASKGNVSSNPVNQVDVASSESTQEANSASLYPISEANSSTDNMLDSTSSIDSIISSFQTENSQSEASSIAETSNGSENLNISSSSNQLNFDSANNKSNQSSVDSIMSFDEESKQFNSSSANEINNSSEITNILSSPNKVDSDAVSDQASSKAATNSNSSISLSPSNMSSTSDSESATNSLDFSNVAEEANNSLASANNSSSSVLSSTSTADNFEINQSGSDNLIDTKASTGISTSEAVSTSNQTSYEDSSHSMSSMNLPSSNMSLTSNSKPATNKSNYSEATEVANNSSTHSSDILNSDSNDSLDSDLYSDSSNLISSPNLETNQTISSKPSEVNNISENPKNVSSSNSVQENSTDHDMSTNSKSSLSSPISTISGSQPKESQSNLLNTTVEINNVIAFNNSSSENSAASNLTSYSNNNSEPGYLNISNEPQRDNHSEVSHSLPSSNSNENNGSSIRLQAILESSKSSTNKISSSLPIINSTSHPQKEENQSNSSDEVKSNNNIESSLGQLNSISNKTYMDSLARLKLSVIYSLPSKSKVMNEKNKKSNTINEEKLIRTSQKNDESQNSGQITALDLSFNKEVETMEDSKTVADKVPDNENVDQSQSDKTSTIDKDKGFFKSSELNSKILDSDNNILKKTDLIKKHGLISDNFFIGLITILGACFIFIFILFKKKKRVKKDID